MAEKPAGETPISEFAFLYECADADVRSRFTEWVKSDPERLLLMLKRSVNPSLHLDNKSEGRLRGNEKPVGRKTVGKKKSRGEIPYEPTP